MSIQTYCGDCLEVMKELPEKSVDMILCDLPYGTTRNPWDVLIPLNELWDAYRRIIKGGGTIALFSQAPFSFVLGGSNLKEFRYEWIWKKSNITGFLNANRTPLKCHENILIFCDKGAPYNPQVSYCPPRKLNSFSSSSSNYGKANRMPDKMTNFRYPQDIIEFDNNKDGKLHPTQKPVDLCEYLIRTYTDEGMTVLDNCMGSGTTGVAAVRTGRNFIGIEKDPEYYKIAIDRINDAEYTVKSRTRLEDFA